MKDRGESEMQKNTSGVVGVMCFLVFCAVTCFNTYRVLVLEATVLEMKENLKKCEKANTQDTNGVDIERLYYQFTTRKRRAISNAEYNSETDDQKNSLNDAYAVNHVSESPVYRRYPTLNTITPSTKDKTTTNKPRVKSRTSKVMRFDDIQDEPRLIVKKSLDSISDGAIDYGSSELESQQDADAVTRKTRAMQSLDGRHPRTGRMKPLPSIHFSGDTSTYVYGTHENYNGNGHLRHLHSIFVDWKANSWVETTGMMSHFDFNQGYLTFKESGLYLIYAQIYYLDTHDLNGYRVYKNDQTILQCTVTLHTATPTQKGNTCYTAGVEYVSEGDKISVGDIIHGHYSLFEPGKSFFGAVKLGDVRARP